MYLHCLWLDALPVVGRWTGAERDWLAFAREGLFANKGYKAEVRMYNRRIEKKDSPRRNTCSGTSIAPATDLSTDG